MDNTQQFNSDLTQVLHKINLDAVDYEASIRLYEVTNISSKELSDIVELAISIKPEITDPHLVSDEDILSALKKGLRYEAFNSSSYTSTAEHKTEVAMLMMLFRELIRGNKNIIKFKLSDDTHPFYPVMWEFSYLIRFDDSALVLIGAGSD